MASSDGTIVTRHEDSEFTTVKKKKFSRKLKSDLKMIETYNLFDEFNNPEFQVQVTKDEDPEMQCKTMPKAVTIVKGEMFQSCDSFL